MMKPSGDGEKWVFNNVSDSVTKTYKALCDVAGIPASASQTGEVGSRGVPGSQVMADEQDDETRLVGRTRVTRAADRSRYAAQRIPS